eukprot:EG_transcript_23191
MPAVSLTYFPLEGLGEKVRLALILAGIPFDDKRVSFADWPKLKPTVKYGVLPVMTMDGKEIYQSEAMLRYIGRLHPNLYPADKVLAIDEAIGLINDFYRAMSPMFAIVMRPATLGYPEDFPKTEEGQAASKAMRERFVATDLPQFLGYFEALLEGHSFAAGDEPTIADCMLIPALRNVISGQLNHVPTTCLDGHPKIKAYIDRFLAIPVVKHHYDEQEKAAAGAPKMTW